MAHWLVTTDADVMQAFLFRVVLASFVKFSFFQYGAKRSSGKNVTEVTYFLSSGI